MLGSSVAVALGSGSWMVFPELDEGSFYSRVELLGTPLVSCKISANQSKYLSIHPSIHPSISRHFLALAAVGAGGGPGSEMELERMALGFIHM